MSKYTVKPILDEADADLLAYKWFCCPRKGYFLRRDGRVNAPVRTVRMHRAVMERVLGRPLASHELIDHIDHDPANNSRSNLRLATAAGNCRNSRKPQLNRLGERPASQFKGVTFNLKNRKWVAQIVCKERGGNKYLGSFTDETDAAKTYDQFAREWFGEFACLNFPMEAANG
jgi:hypothetical protein